MRDKTLIGIEYPLRTHNGNVIVATKVVTKVKKIGEEKAR